MYTTKQWGTVIDCNTTNLDLEANTTAPVVSYQWSGGLPATQTVNAAPTTNMTFTVTITNTADGNCTSTADVSITTDLTPPTATLSSSNDIDCINTSSTLTAGPTGLEYNFGGGFSNTATDNITLGGDYTVTVRGANGCISTADVNVDEDMTTPDLETLTEIDYCDGQTIELSTLEHMDNNSAPGLTLEFQDNTGAPLANQNELMVTANTTIRLEATASNGCTDFVSIDINFNDLPEVTLSPDPAICGPGTLNISFTGGPSNGTATVNDGTNDIIVTLDAAGEAVEPFTLTSAGTLDIQLIEISDGTCIANTCL